MAKINPALPRYRVRYRFNYGRDFNYSIIINAVDAAAAEAQAVEVMERDGYPMRHITILSVEPDALT